MSRRLATILGKEAVVIPRAFALERADRVVPVDHEQADNVVSLLFEQVRRYGGVNTSPDNPTTTRAIIVFRRLFQNNGLQRYEKHFRFAVFAVKSRKCIVFMVFMTTFVRI